MIIYKCIITGDEMFADTFKVIEHDLYYEVEGKTVTRTEGDIELAGANPSAEEMNEGSDLTTTSGVDIVLNHKLSETPFDKKAYMTYIKDYMKAVKAKLQADKPDRVEDFMGGIQKVIKDILGNFKDYQFFTGESMNPDGMVALLNYREDGITPYMIFFKDGLEAEKC